MSAFAYGPEGENRMPPGETEGKKESASFAETGEASAPGWLETQGDESPDSEEARQVRAEKAAAALERAKEQAEGAFGNSAPDEEPLQNVG